MGDMEHFTVHDLRYTCCSLLAAQGTLGHVAERCLNHKFKLKCVEGIYDRYDYFDEWLRDQNMLDYGIKSYLKVLLNEKQHNK